MRAIVRNNIPYCEKCNIPLDGGIHGVSLFFPEKGGTYYLFNKRCRKCNRNSEYMLDLEMENRYPVGKGIVETL